MGSASRRVRIVVVCSDFPHWKAAGGREHDVSRYSMERSYAQFTVMEGFRDAA